MNYCLLDITYFTYAADDFIWVTSLHDCSKLNQHHEKCQHPMWGEDSVKLTSIVELLSRKHCRGSKTMWKGSSGPRFTKSGQECRGLKSFRLTNQSLKSFSQIGMSLCSKEWVKELQPPWVSYQPLMHGGGYVMVWGTFPNCKVRDLHQVKGKLNRTSYQSILQHHMIPSETWLVGQG